jgi:hypothetical protein
MTDLPVAPVFKITPGMTDAELRDLLVWQAAPPLFRVPNPPRFETALPTHVIQVRNRGASPVVMAVLSQQDHSRPLCGWALEPGGDMVLAIPVAYNDKEGCLLIKTEGDGLQFLVLALS